MSDFFTGEIITVDGGSMACSGDAQKKPLRFRVESYLKRFGSLFGMTSPFASTIKELNHLCLKEECAYGRRKKGEGYYGTYRRLR